MEQENQVLSGESVPAAPTGIEQVRNAMYLDGEQTRMMCEVKLYEGDDFMPYVASSTDTAGFGREVFNRCAADEFGVVKPMQPSPAHEWDGKGWILNTSKAAEMDAAAQAQAITHATEAAKQALQTKIDQVAQSLGFSAGNAVMLYAGFDNQFKPLAQAFGAWEAGIWVAANEYMTQVKTGAAPMLTPDEAVARVPAFEL